MEPSLKYDVAADDDVVSVEDALKELALEQLDAEWWSSTDEMSFADADRDTIEAAS